MWDCRPRPRDIVIRVIKVMVRVSWVRLTVRVRIGVSTGPAVLYHVLLKPIKINISRRQTLNRQRLSGFKIIHAVNRVIRESSKVRRICKVRHRVSRVFA